MFCFVEESLLKVTPICFCYYSSKLNECSKAWYAARSHAPDNFFVYHQDQKNEILKHVMAPVARLQKSGCVYEYRGGVLL